MRRRGWWNSKRGGGGAPRWPVGRGSRKLEMERGGGEEREKREKRASERASERARAGLLMLLLFFFLHCPPSPGAIVHRFVRGCSFIQWSYPYACPSFAQKAGSARRHPYSCSKSASGVGCCYLHGPSRACECVCVCAR